MQAGVDSPDPTNSIQSFATAQDRHLGRPQSSEWSIFEPDGPNTAKTGSWNLVLTAVAPVGKFARQHCSARRGAQWKFGVFLLRLYAAAACGATVR